jgi:2-amino-4-hydroxy-6-hydroxymethyldihydropteridine diphosphokinase
LSSRYAYLLSLGSNVEPRRWVPRAVALLRARFAAVRVSPSYDVGAVGEPSQPRFVNLAARIETDLPLRALRAACRHIEALCGRERSDDRFAPRTLDLDVVYDGRAGAAVHADLPEQAYVLVPCADVWPGATLQPGGPDLRSLADERFPGWGAARRMEDA